MKYNYICLAGVIPMTVFGYLWKSKIMLFVSLIGYIFDTNHVFEEHKIKKRTKDEYKILYRKCLPCVIKNVGILSFPYIFLTAYLNNYFYGGYSVYDYNYKIQQMLL